MKKVFDILIVVVLFCCNDTVGFVPGLPDKARTAVILEAGPINEGPKGSRRTSRRMPTSSGPRPGSSVLRWLQQGI